MNLIGALNFPAIAFEIPLEEFDGNRRSSATPPPHVQRLLEPPKNDISLPDIEEKLAEAEQRRREVSVCVVITTIFYNHIYLFFIVNKGGKI